jgi:CRP/FNR family transcriptional regulator
VSLTLSLFNDVGLITLDRRTVRINDADALKSLRRLAPTRIQVPRRSDTTQATERTLARETGAFAEV